MFNEGKLSKRAVRRLTTLANYLARRRGHFAMHTWCQHNESVYGVVGAHGIRVHDNLKASDLIQCGMAACAFGHAATIPAFKRAGLKLRASFSGVFKPYYAGLSEFNAAAAFFDIPQDAANTLFTPIRDGNEETPAQWAKRCREFVKANS